MYGGSGEDIMTGNSGPVYMQAGSGTDSLKSVAGNDTLVGGSGGDNLQGGSGNNLLEAGSGSDYVNGGTGIATIFAGSGNDTIIALNGHADDTIYTSALATTGVIWEDALNIGGTTVTDIIVGPTANYTLQEVPGFSNGTYGGFANGPTSVLNGGKFEEPTLLATDKYMPFTGRPLFADTGPTAKDVKQYINPAGGGVNATGTNLDDSWLLSALDAIALTNPQVIQQNVVNFGDGTYGVKLINVNTGVAQFYRVDDYLPVNEYGDTNSAYASMGAQNAIWVPIVEKAFAYYATMVGYPTYADLQAANGATATDVYQAFGATSANVGSVPLNGAGGFPNVTELGQTIATFAQQNAAMCINLTTAVTGTSLNTGAAVTLAVTREYTILSYNESFTGVVNSVVLRDPSGANSEGVTVTLASLYAATGTFDYGFF
jgi:hypothetical protein